MAARQHRGVSKRAAADVVIPDLAREGARFPTAMTVLEMMRALDPLRAVMMRTDRA